MAQVLPGALPLGHRSAGSQLGALRRSPAFGPAEAVRVVRPRLRQNGGEDGRRPTMSSSKDWPRA